MPDCQKRRLASQEYHCVPCGLRWDADDPDPPDCPRDPDPPDCPRDTAAAPCIGCGTGVTCDRGDCPSKQRSRPNVIALRNSAIMGGLPVARGSLTDRLATLCENMRAGVVTLGEAADMLEDLTVEVGLKTAG